MKTHAVILTILFKFSLCRDFHVGFLKKGDILVAQDILYKEQNNVGYATAKYGRIFHCPITYMKVADRLGVDRPPTVTITRGGLQKKYVTFLLTSSYGNPIAVNIHVGCEKKRKSTTPRARISSQTPSDDDDESQSSAEKVDEPDEEDSNNTKESLDEKTTHEDNEDKASKESGSNEAKNDSDKKENSEQEGHETTAATDVDQPDNNNNNSDEE